MLAVGVLHRFEQCPRRHTCTSCRRHHPPPRPRSWQPRQPGSAAPAAAAAARGHRPCRPCRPCHPCPPSSRRCPCRRPRHPRLRPAGQARPSASPSWQDRHHPSLRSSSSAFGRGAKRSFVCLGSRSADVFCQPGRTANLPMRGTPLAGASFRASHSRRRPRPRARTHPAPAQAGRSRHRRSRPSRAA